MASIPRIAWMVLLLALVGAMASLFGPHERWWGVDIGATGTAVFGFTLWTGAWLFARHPEEIFPVEWSVAERRAWTGLLFLMLVFVSFARFMVSIADLDSTPMAIAEIPSKHFMWSLFVLLIAWAVVAKTIRGPATDLVELDERDLRIQHRANRAADSAFIFVVVGIVLLLAYLPGARLGWWLSPLIAAHALIGLLIGRATVARACQVGCYALERR
jgi:hypothetical protein